MSSAERFPAVLVLGASRACLAVARSLARRGIPVDVAAKSPRDPVRLSNAVRTVHKLPDFVAAPEYFLDRLLSLLDAGRYELIVPASAAALAALHRFQQPLGERARLACAPAAVLDRADDSLRIARECDVPVQAEAGCPGDRVGIETVVHEGRPLVLFQYRCSKEYPYAGGEIVLAVAEPLDETLAGFTRRLLAALEWEGPATVEFRRDPASGAVVLNGVNGSCCESLPLSSRAGLDFPYYDWQLARGEEPDPPAEYQAGVRARWAAGDLRRVGEILAHSRRDAALRKDRWRECREFFADFGPGTSDMVWSPGDPFPAIVELAGTALALTRGALKGVATGITPLWLRQDLRTAWEIGAIPGLFYLRSRAATGFARRWKRRRRLPERVETILFVCHGNIIRSALAEALLRHELPEGSPRIASAGVGARPGRESDARARAVARELGVSLEQHRARPVTDALLAGADVIFVMDELNVALLLALHPQAQPKLRFLGEWNTGAESRVIADPYRGSLEDVRQCGQLIEACAVELARELA